jgi:tRNA1Val (adenine37-N6)-methyltransferase
MFQFKKFVVNDERSAMKVGTDAVLLGAWTPIDNNPKTILDIGTGTGIIALMLAQRTNASQIDGLEVDDDAFEEASENFENSPWNDRLFCYHANLDAFMDEPEDEYDLIVCNPPFFFENFKSNIQSRNLARFQDAMPFCDLVEAASMFLSNEGFFSVIIPFHEEAKFIELCAEQDLYPVKITHVRGAFSTPIIRSLLAFKRFEMSVLEADELVVEISRHQYSEAYIELCKDFYLKM